MSYKGNGDTKCQNTYRRIALENNVIKTGKAEGKGTQLYPKNPV
jgi:hypothetical protein